MIRHTQVPSGQKLPEPVVLFRKVEDEEILKQMEKLGKSKALHKEIVEKPDIQYPVQTELAFEPLKAEIVYDQFGKIDLRVAQILEAVKVPKSKKLLKLYVDLGFEKRTIISGIALHYDPEQLVGKKVIVVANLAPVQIMGIESRGMVLAGSLGASLELPQIQGLSPGSAVS
jgi:methionyl-tRNA synthetase